MHHMVGIAHVLDEGRLSRYFTHGPFAVNNREVYSKRASPTFNKPGKAPKRPSKRDSNIEMN